MAATEYLVLARDASGYMRFAGRRKATSPRRAVDAVRGDVATMPRPEEGEVWAAVPVRNWSMFGFTTETREVVTEIGPPTTVASMFTNVVDVEDAE